MTERTVQCFRCANITDMLKTTEEKKVWRVALGMYNWIKTQIHLTRFLARTSFDLLWLIYIFDLVNMI